MLRKRIEELEQEKERAERCLAELDTEMIYRGFTIDIVANIRSKLLRNLNELAF